MRSEDKRAVEVTFVTHGHCTDELLGGEKRGIRVSAFLVASWSGPAASTVILVRTQPCGSSLQSSLMSYKSV